MTWRKRPAPTSAELAEMIIGRLRILAKGLPLPLKEYKFALARKTPREWRFDLAWPMFRVAVEIDGGTWRQAGGAHRGTGFIRDIEKGNAAAFDGWTVLHYTPDQVQSDQAALELAPFLMYRFAELLLLEQKMKNEVHTI